MKKSINYFKFYRNFDGNLLDKDLKHIYCVIRVETSCFTMKYEKSRVSQGTPRRRMRAETHITYF